MLLASFNTHAFINYDKGEWGSGGGNALVCFPAGQIAIGEESFDVVSEIKKNQNTIPDKFLPFIESIEMFDLYEAKKRRGLNSKKPEILEIQDDEHIYDYLDRLGNRFKNIIPMMHYMIGEAKKLIPDSQLIFHEYAVKYQNDLGSVTLPSKNCVIATMAAQVFLESRENGFYEVHIDQRLYDHPKHSNQSRATLVMHELVYGLARKFFDHKSSAATRNVVRYFISYDTTLTEGFISSSLYKLGFYDKTQVDTPFVIEYSYSAAMMYIGYHVQSFKDAVIDWHSDFKEGLYSQEELFKKISQEATDYQKYLAGTLETESAASETEKKSIVMRFGFFIESAFETSNLLMLEESLLLSSKILNNMVFEEILTGTICRGSTSIPIPDQTNNKECFEPVKLDTIIPRFQL